MQDRALENPDGLVEGENVNEIKEYQSEFQGNLLRGEKKQCCMKLLAGGLTGHAGGEYHTGQILQGAKVYPTLLLVQKVLVEFWMFH